MRGRVFVLLAIAAVLIAGCGTIDFNSLVAALYDNGALATLRPCSQPPPNSTIPFQVRAVHERVSNLTNVNVLPDRLRNDVVVRAVLSQAEIVTSKASFAVLPAGSAVEPYAPAVAPPSEPLTQHDFFDFANLVAEYALRQPTSVPGVSDGFAQAIGQYYSTYFAGKFNTYFGASFAQPTISMTISDNEITQAAVVFVEYLFDEVMNSQVWFSTVTVKGKKTTTYYPGGNSNKPTVATLNKEILVKIPTSDDCTMTVAKAKLINDIAQTFATAASSDTSLTIKSVGGVEIGLGILGKLNIGDNSTLTSLVKSVASEVVLRLTAQFAYTVLAPYYINDSGPSSTVAMARIANGAPPPIPTTSQAVRALFISPNPY
jgi:hypothetical protein